ncbi:MAG: TonB family protein [Proteobacteria bacterium]|nr:TonB family protein [Pseudomonadota bacterium]
MSHEDIDNRVVGEVVVDIHLDERGLVSDTKVISSTKPSLTEAVVAAVSQWKISPVSTTASHGD